MVLALALIHHLAIGGNVPLEHVASTFARRCKRHIIEFVPKDDPQVRRMLGSRRDVFAEYSLDGFRAAFQGQFDVVSEESHPKYPPHLFGLERRDVDGSAGV